MKNRQVNISIKYGSEIYKKNFMEQDALAYIDFLETSGLWYEIEEATGGEQPKLDEDNIEKDDTNEQ